MLQRVSVVTCFLLRRLPGPEGALWDEVLVLRRSQRVGTYRGRWAGISGYIEGTPEEQAYRELQEEAGLERSDVEMVRRGEPLDIADPGMGKLWTVHPFLFLARNPGKMRLDWEHVEARWILPFQIVYYDTVPGLPEVLEQVYPLAAGAA